MQNSQYKKKYFPVTVVTTLSTGIIFAIIAACSDQQAKAKPNIIQKDPPRAGIVAKIGGKELTEEELIGDDKLELFDIKKREYEVLNESINRAAQRILIGEEAKKANMSLEEYIDKKIVGGAVKISDKDYQKFVKEKKIPEAQITPQIKERINAYLVNQKKQDAVQAHLAKLTKNNPIESYLKKPKMNVQVEAGNAPFFGKADAAVTIVEFSDFQCPFCGRAAETVTELKKKYGNKIKLAFRHFPLPMHKDAKPASEMSMCVNEQGTDKFWKFHDIAFKNMDKLNEEGLIKHAKDAGADVAKATECFKSGKYKDLVQKDLEYGEKIGVKSTPTFFINGQMVAGALPLESFSEIIDEELAAAKK